MKPGPRPTPTAQLHSWRAKNRQGEPQPPKIRPTCPSSLSKPAKKKFHEVVKALESMNILGQVDKDCISLYADLFCWLAETRDFLKKHGDSFGTYDAYGNLSGYRQYPQVRLALQLAQQVARLEGELGLTPAGRASLRVAPPDTTDDPLAGILAGLQARR